MLSLQFDFFVFSIACIFQCFIFWVVKSIPYEGTETKLVVKMDIDIINMIKVTLLPGHNYNILLSLASALCNL